MLLIPDMDCDNSRNFATYGVHCTVETHRIQSNRQHLCETLCSWRMGRREFHTGADGLPDLRNEVVSNTCVLSPAADLADCPGAITWSG